MEFKVFDLENGIKRYVLKNSKNLEVSFLNYGCIIEKLNYKNKNLVLSFDDSTKYFNNTSYFGALVGRTSGRIENATYEIDGEKIILDKNNDENNLHGGKNGLSNKFFEGKIVGNSLIFSIKDYDEKLDSVVDFEIKYTLHDDKDVLDMEYSAKSDKKAYINLTNHTYFNLSGFEENGLKHKLQINADEVFYLKENMIPEKLVDVTGTVFDFREKKEIGKDINVKEKQFDITRYYDHPFKLNKKNLDYDILLESELSDTILKIKTNQRYVVFYAGNFLEPRHIGIALETQNAPNGINMSNEEDYQIIDKEKPYYSKTTLIFEGRQL